MVDSYDVSVVVSGPILGTERNPKEYTERACLSVRQFLPNAELILSTWENEDVEGIEYDKLILNHDPGPNTGNVNRQICSRKAGIRGANRKYVLAIRSESEIKRLDFMKYLDLFDDKQGEFCFLTHRIVIPATYPACRGELFHIGDWYFLGYREDVLSFWDLPYMDDNIYNKTQDDILYNPHRYLITAFIKKFYPLTFLKNDDITTENRIIYERVVAENFVVTGFYEYGIESLKYPLSYKFFNKLFHKEVGYTFCEWKELYNKYSGGKLQIKKNIYEGFIINICIPLKKTCIGQVFFKVRRKIFRLEYWE